MKFFHHQFRLLACLFCLGSVNFVGSAWGQSATPEKLEPEMVRIEPGHFDMGVIPEPDTLSPQSPQHRVTIRYAFEVSKYDITRDEFAAFVDDTKRGDGGNCDVYDGNSFHRVPGRTWRDPGFPQTGRDPVVCVSWDEAQAYINWLNDKTGKNYRLLSEAEWEYAARAGTTTTYYWGDDLGIGHANCQNCGSGWDSKQTSPVGSFAPNPFGLYDMLGDVWQWTADCWNGSYVNAPDDGSAWKKGSCHVHALRGGSWYYGAKAISTFRYGDVANFRDSTYGFRIARTLGPAP
jgi:formylglycine-generating enzyme required for sulfatase activity